MVFRMNQQDVRNHPHLSSTSQEDPASGAAGSSHADAIEVLDDEPDEFSRENTTSQSM